MWIRDSECFNLIRGCWHVEASNDIMVKLSLCCAKLEEWGGGLVKDMRKQLREY